MSKITSTDLREGLQAVLYIALSYIFLGLAAGFALREAGFSSFQILFMSLTAFTGAGQFMAASMVTVGASALSIVIMTLFLNLRMSLQTSSLSPHVQNESMPFLMLFGQTTADEAYGVNIYEFNNNATWSPQKAIVANIGAYLIWVMSSYAGALMGSVISIPTDLVNYILIAMFISMALDQIESKTHAIVALVAGISVVALKIAINNNIVIVFGTVIAATVGYLITEKKQESIHQKVGE